MGNTGSQAWAYSRTGYRKKEGDLKMPVTDFEYEEVD
jgi:hypothetical protein